MALTQREAFARTMEHLCNHDSHGYTQGNRWGNGTKETVDLGDGVTVEVMLGDRDCSSAIISALDAVGVNTGDATYTGNMKWNILNSGLFEWKDMNFSAQRGDIYLNEVCHTAMCTSPYGSSEGDMLAEFSISENGTAYGNEGDQTGWESHVTGYYDYPWDGILHWISDGETLGGEGSSGVTPSGDIDSLASAVIRGEFGTGEDRKAALGDKYDAVQKRVNEMLNGETSSDPESETSNIDTLAYAVIQGQYGVGEERKEALGDKYDAVQKRVNEILSGSSSSSNSNVDELANEVIRGKYGVGEERKSALGSLYDAVQKRVNEILER